MKELAYIIFTSILVNNYVVEIVLIIAKTALLCKIYAKIADLFCVSRAVGNG